MHTSARDAWGRDNEGILDDVLHELGADMDDNSPRLFLNLARGNLHSDAALTDAVRSGAIRRADDMTPDQQPAPQSRSYPLHASCSARAGGGLFPVAQA